MKTKKILAIVAISLMGLTIACKKETKTTPATPAPTTPAPTPVDNATPLVGVYSGTITYENRFTGAVDPNIETAIQWKVSKVDNNTIKIESAFNNVVSTGTLQLGPITAVITKTTDPIFTGEPYYRLNIGNYVPAFSPGSTYTGAGSISLPNEHGYYAIAANNTKYFGFSFKATAPLDSTRVNFISIKP
jgi:hypothetical protein